MRIAAGLKTTYLGLLSDSSCLEHIMKPCPSPRGIPNSPSLPLQPLQALDLLHLSPPVASTLDGGCDGVLRQGLDVLQAVGLLIAVPEINLDEYFN